MAIWTQYNPDDYDENAYGIIPAGKYRVRVEQAEDKTSKTGKDMVKLTLTVSGYSMKLWYYIVLDGSTPEAVKQTNQRLGSFWNCFNIQPGNMNYQDWIGRVGGVKVRHTKDQDDNDRADVHYFLKRHEVDRLPAWQEGSNQQSGSQDSNGNTPQNSGDFDPFSNSDWMSSTHSDSENEKSEILPF